MKSILIRIKMSGATEHRKFSVKFFLWILFFIICYGQASAQSTDNFRTIKGRVLDEKGEGAIGATVRASATISIQTNVNGEYTLKIPLATTELLISYIGYQEEKVLLGKESNYISTLKLKENSMSEVVITGYSSQRKKDIIGAVSVINASDLKKTPSPNLVAQLQGRAAGVSVSTSGDPSARANIRIRGFASYGNNNPLYIIDGVATTDAARINSEDIESLQVLKDASSASIYGARAANGVVIITTKHGQAGKTTLTYDSYVGFQQISAGSAPEMLDPQGVMDYLTLTKDASYTDPVFGKYGAFKIPDYYIVSNNFKGGVSASDPRANPDLYTITDFDNAYQIFKPTLEGTDWYKEMSRSAILHNQQLSASGGNEKSNFYFSMNYLNQQGTFKYTGYDRYSIRLNSTFKITDYLTVGENLQVVFDNRKGNRNLGGEGNPWYDAYRSSSFVPVRDIKGGWGGSKIGGTAGNGYNPVASLYRTKDLTEKVLRTSGNVFATATFTDYLSAKTSFGIDATRSDTESQTLRQYENTENTRITGFGVGSTSRFNWIWTNTLNFNKRFSDDHLITGYIGTEALKNYYTGIDASKQRYDFEDLSFLSLNTALPQSLADVSASNQKETITMSSYFTRADYSFKDRYLFNATFRRDGASVFGQRVRYGNFPAAGIGWRISGEPFMRNATWVTDMKIRAGWGKMGSISNVAAINQYSAYESSPNENNYPIGGTSSGSVQGYGIANEGNVDTKWETTETVNAGVDISAFDDTWNLAIDVYSKNTKDLLVPSLLNGLEMNIVKPRINLGTMNNKGIDVTLGKRGKIRGELSYDASMTFTHYKNELTKLNEENTPQILGAGRLGNVSYTGEGYPVSSFYGYQIDGFYNTQEEVANGPTINGLPVIVGTWRYKDLNNDGNITTKDAGVMGSPHPDFQMAFNLGLHWRGFDFSSLLFWNQGNVLFNYNKFFTYMGALGGGIAAGKLNDAWTPETMSTAKTPRLGVGDENGYTAFLTGNPTSFYLEPGSYLRMKSLQLGYTLPDGMLRKAGISSFRVYIQAQNLFTITKYTGADPDLGLIQRDGTDQTLGIDQSGYPNPKQYILGVSLSF